MSPLEICFEDDDLIAINKPHGLLVHRTSLASDTNKFAVQLLRDQIQQHVYPVHRLDRKTGGVLLFAKSKAMNVAMQKQFAARAISKKYVAIVRGHIGDEGEIDYPLTNAKGVDQSALTKFNCISQTEIELASSARHKTSRYSLVELLPHTGRMHQLRKHMAHIFHPIIGDRPHGCNKQNRFFKNHFNMNTMLLHAKSLAFTHPRSEAPMEISAPMSKEFERMIGSLGFPKTDI